MAEEMRTQDLRERLAVIEKMIAEGRRSTESWGWTFVLWGVAFYVALGWSSCGRGATSSAISWPVTMICAFILTLAIGSKKGSGHSVSGIGRAVTCVWIAMGFSMLLLFPALGFSGALDFRMFVVLLAAILGGINAASGMILRWRMQIACALVWFAASVAGTFVSKTHVWEVFLPAIFFCQIVFGIYAMISDRKRNQQSGTAHA